jgi:hypothetical protein
VIAAFRESLQRQKIELENVMALAGEDPSERERSTVSNIYGNEATADALIAKTGTVNPSVTLAGMASTEEGDVYFGIIYGTNGRKADWTAARTKIRGDVMKLFKKFHNKKEIDYDPTRFMAFDKNSHLRELKTSEPETKMAADDKSQSRADDAEKVTNAMPRTMGFFQQADPIEIIYSNDFKLGNLP